MSVRQARIQQDGAFQESLDAAIRCLIGGGLMQHVKRKVIRSSGVVRRYAQKAFEGRVDPFCIAMSGARGSGKKWVRPGVCGRHFSNQPSASCGCPICKRTAPRLFMASLLSGCALHLPNRFRVKLSMSTGANTDLQPPSFGDRVYQVMYDPLSAFVFFGIRFVGEIRA